MACAAVGARTRTDVAAWERAWSGRCPPSAGPAREAWQLPNRVAGHRSPRSVRPLSLDSLLGKAPCKQRRPLHASALGGAQGRARLVERVHDRVHRLSQDGTATTALLRPRSAQCNGAAGSQELTCCPTQSTSPTSPQRSPGWRKSLPPAQTAGQLLLEQRGRCYGRLLDLVGRELHIYLQQLPRLVTPRAHALAGSGGTTKHARLCVWSSF